MGVIVPQVISEDRASGALVVDGGLRFDSSKSHNLINNNTRSASSADYTVSVWVKRVSLNSSGLNAILQYETGDTFAFSLTFYADKVYAYDSSGFDADAAYSDGLLRDTSGWYHLHYKRTSGGTGTLYINGVQQFKQTSGTLNLDAFAYNGSIGYRQKDSTRYLGAYLSNLYVIDGQALNPSSFGFTDPLTNTWRPKKYTGTYGTKGFFLPFDGSAPIGQDQSGRGNNWTPVNFGGSNTLEKATGALPILNTDGGGKVARVGVRTDSSASSLVLALPLVGIKSDFSNAVNSGTSNKAITLVGGATASSVQSNFYGGSFYFDGNADCVDVSASSDFAFGTGDFTVECWVNTSTYSTDTVYRRIFMTDGPTGNASGNFQLIIDISAGALYLWSNTGDLDYITSGIVANGNWNHIAACRSGSTLRAFVNGIQVGSTTYSGSISPNGGTPRPRIGNYDGSGGGGDFSGYIQDFRIYKGLAKYTQNFIPASTDPDILPDTPSGVSYTSNLTQITDGAISSGPSSTYLTLAPSADFGFGTGDFTIEFFVYETTKVYTSVSNPRAFDFDGTFQMVLHSTADGSTIRIDYADSTLMTSNGTLFVNKWNHIALVRSGSTLSLYINGVFDKSVSNSTNVPTPSSTIYIGRYYGSDSGWINGFISNFHVVKGTALYTSNFTPPTGPISSVANTKLLCCKSNSSATAFDVSPGTITANGNAAATNFNPFTVNINTVRGKQSGWATLNRLSVGDFSGEPKVQNGNLTAHWNGSSSTHGGSGDTYGGATSTIGMSSGKWYWEIDVTEDSGNNVCMTGVQLPSHAIVDPYGSTTDGSWTWYRQTARHNNTTTATTLNAIGNRLTMIAVDMDNGYLWFGQNGFWEKGNPGNGSSTAVYTNLKTFDTSRQTVYATTGSAGQGAIWNARYNFGQKPFKFPPPAGFQPLALANTPRPTIVRPDQFVGVTTYSGDGTTEARAINVGFKPDFVWIKGRNTAYSHLLYDTVRGIGPLKGLNSNETRAEGATVGDDATYGYLSSFNNNGFSVIKGSDATSYTNGGSSNYVGWAWKAGGNSNTYNINDVGYATASAAGLTAGTITPTGASVNTKSGFSIITYNGAGTNTALTSTISHGLTQSPTFMIVKARTGTNAADDWFVYHKSIGPTKRTRLNLTNAADTQPWMGDTEPTSSLITLNQGWYSVNYTGHTHILYAWAEVPGFSKFGSHTGTSGQNFISLGFEPELVIIKNSSSSSYPTYTGWAIFDSERTPYNAVSNALFANKSQVENLRGNGGPVTVADFSLDLLSNGFCLRDNGASEINLSGNTYIYAAWAKAPTQNLYGAQANAR